MARPPSLSLPHKGGGDAFRCKQETVKPKASSYSARSPQSAVVAIGVGCRAGVPGEAIAALVRRALASFGAPEGDKRMFTLADKASEPGLVEAARLIGAPLIALPLEAIQLEARRVLTHSQAAQARFGVPAIAEAAALAGAGAGGRLLGPRLAADGATCAIALSGDIA